MSTREVVVVGPHHLIPAWCGGVQWVIDQLERALSDPRRATGVLALWAGPPSGRKASGMGWPGWVCWGPDTLHRAAIAQGSHNRYSTRKERPPI